MMEIILSPTQSRDIEVASGDVLVKDTHGKVRGILHLTSAQSGEEQLDLTTEQFESLWERSKIPVAECLTTEQAIHRLGELMSE